MNIVIVDDDLAFLRSIEIIMSSQGHHVSSFCDPATACLYMKQNPDIDVLLVDYVMGEMNGEEVLKTISGMKSNCRKTIMITGHKESIKSTRILHALGVDRILCKPLDLDQLYELVEK